MFKKLTYLFIFLFALSLSSNAYSQELHTIDFEIDGGIGTDWNWEVAENSDNPPLEFVNNPAAGGINGSSTSAKFTARVDGNPWALFFTTDDGEFTFDENNCIVKMMVYKPNISNVTFKVEGGTGTPTEVQAINTVTNEWEELTFDFTALIGSTFSKLVIIPDHEARTEENIIYLDNIQVPDGVVNEVPAPTVAAPVPTDPEESVISIYSDAYTSLEGTDFSPNWGQATAVTHITIEDNNTLLYEYLNYQGTQLAEAQDLTEMKYLHIDFWTPNSTELMIFLVSQASGEQKYDFTIKTEEWVSVDIPLSHFTDLGLAIDDIHQLKVEGNGTIYLDNIYFKKETNEVPVPTVAAPAPTITEENVLSIFSDAYTNIDGTDFNPSWGQSTTVSQITIQDNNTLLYENLNYQGTQFAAAQDLTEMNYLHVDFWTPNSSTLMIYLISESSGEQSFSFEIETEKWLSVFIPLTYFTDLGITLNDIHQLKVEGNGTVYFDNIYFSTETDEIPAPTVAAPVPTDPVEDVISIFSDAYTSIDGTDFNPDWGQSTVVSTITIEDNNTLLYENLNYQGTQFAAAQDLTEMKYMHVDFWSPNSTALMIYLISESSGEQSYSFEITTEEWVSVDIPLSYFTELGMTINDIHQLKVEGNGNVYFDNIYFKKDPVSVDESLISSESFILNQNYPNPFTSNTQISFSLLKSNEVSLKVYDMFGNEIETIVNDYLSNGDHKYNFNANNLSSGKYLFTLTVGSASVTKSMSLTK